MKYHKIRGIELNICTAEAMIAYNVAFLVRNDILKAYEKCTCDFQRVDVVHEGVSLCMERLSFNDKINKKYNIDAIFSCLNAGLEEYLNAKHRILMSYEEIGNIFKSLYL